MLRGEGHCEVGFRVGAGVRNVLQVVMCVCREGMEGMEGNE